MCPDWVAYCFWGGLLVGKRSSCLALSRDHVANSMQIMPAQQCVVRAVGGLMATDNLRVPTSTGHALGGSGGGGAVNEVEMRAKRAAFLARMQGGGGGGCNDATPSGGELTDLAASLRQRQQQ